MVAPVRCSVPSFMHASRIARISACAVGSWLWATLLALSARIWPSLTITVANGLPPSMTFCRARSMVRCAKSITGALVVGVLVNLLEPGLVHMRMGVLAPVMGGMGVLVVRVFVLVVNVRMRVLDAAVLVLVRMRALVGVLFGHL